MGKKTTEKFKMLGAIGLVTTLLAACSGGGGGGANEVNQSNSGNTSKNTTTTEAPAPTNNTEISGEVKVLSIFGSGWSDYFNSLMVEFNKVYPNIKVTYMQQLTDDLPALISAGDNPDILLDGRFPSEWIKDNLIQDLTPFIKADPTFNPDDFYEPAYKRGFSADGRIWQLPYAIDPNFSIVYNREVLEQYGHTEFPEMNSLQEFEDFAKQFWVAENGEQVMTTFSPLELYGNFNSLLTFAYMNGADSTTFYDPATNKVNFHDPKIVEALEWLVRFKRENIDDERIKKLQESLPKNTSRLIAGKSLFEAAVVVHVQENLKLNPDLELVPMPTPSLWFGGHSMTMTTLGKKENEAAAWALMKWISMDKAAAEFKLKNAGSVSAIKDNPYLVEQAKTDPAMSVVYDIVQRAQKTPPYIPVEFESELNAKYGDVISGKIEPKAFLEHMTQFTQAKLDEQAK
ncbi:ABC-type glycerol-3-phosphate transport system, substrate-binding protein [Paenibacillaceae bacterium GAS479]|nr:ABC-type glycerol-3-phosphate transport system, substrate-binding protein [Paenibacillaceae bacterium GAS479]